MKLLYSFIILSILPIALFAQSNFHSGYVLKNNGDTLKGYIDYREWQRSPRKIDFKTDLNDKSVSQFTPASIKAFQISGMVTYVGYIGIISTDKTEFPNLPLGLDTSKRLDTTFLKLLTTGKYLTLYSQEDNIKTRYFIAETNKMPIELKYYQYYNNNNQIEASAIYKGQLLIYINKYLEDNNKVSPKLEKTTYSGDDLGIIVNAINRETKPATAIKKTLTTRIYIGLGLNQTNTKYEEIHSEYPRTYNYKDAHLSPKINLGIDLFDSPNRQKFIFRGDLSFTYTNPQFNLIDPLNKTFVNGISKFNQYTVAFTPQILFGIYTQKNFKIYIDAGVGVNFSTYTNNERIVNAHYYEGGTAIVTNLNKIDYLEGVWFSLPIQLSAVIYNKVEIFCNFTPYSQHSNSSNNTFSNQSMGLGVKYFLGKH